MERDINISKETVEKLISSVVDLEKRYAHSLKNATKERRSKVTELVHEIAAKDLDRA